MKVNNNFEFTVSADDIEKLDQILDLSKMIHIQQNNTSSKNKMSDSLSLAKKNGVVIKPFINISLNKFSIKKKKK